MKATTLSRKGNDLGRRRRCTRTSVPAVVFVLDSRRSGRVGGWIREWVYDQRENRAKSSDEQRVGQMQNFLSTRRGWHRGACVILGCRRRPLLRRLDPENLPPTEQDSVKRDGYPWAERLIRYRFVLFDTQDFVHFQFIHAIIFDLYNNAFEIIFKFYSYVYINFRNFNLVKFFFSWNANSTWKINNTYLVYI